MNVHTDSALRALDATTATLSAGEQERARATLERIVATTPSTPAAQPAAPTPARGSRRRLILLPMAALTLALAWMVIPALGGDNPAYASWTATPASVTSVELSAVAAACRDKLRGSSIDLDRARLVLSERRGDHVALLYRTEDPDMSGACLARNPRGSTDVDDVDDGVGGSTGPALKAPATGYTQGAISQFDGASITDGAVGAAVTGITIHAGTLTVNASVQNGRYVAWWPGPAFPSGYVQPSGKGGPEPILTYDLTLTDGTVIHNAQPTLPS
ncbi:hypothetical protein [Actinopolymorpha pittospori]|uniref:Uncharacterized protein n=1 Tax=Actinopolymorpha pittospori TaxID=648752 RepID=A0A927MQH8_9ACTN|nr:hypothetical protein [Actinopolymorpha pittospori]MBE1604824.1 hypothetical protein [Actinopolymorpha pittospori]